MRRRLTLFHSQCVYNLTLILLDGRRSKGGVWMGLEERFLKTVHSFLLPILLCIFLRQRWWDEDIPYLHFFLFFFWCFHVKTWLLGVPVWIVWFLFFFLCLSCSCRVRWGVWLVWFRIWSYLRCVFLWFRWRCETSRRRCRCFLWIWLRRGLTWWC